jgi:hypothetical protein
MIPKPSFITGILVGALFSGTYRLPRCRHTILATHRSPRVTIYRSIWIVALGDSYDKSAAVRRLSVGSPYRACRTGHGDKVIAARLDLALEAVDLLPSMGGDESFARCSHPVRQARKPSLSSPSQTNVLRIPHAISLEYISRSPRLPTLPQPRR